MDENYFGSAVEHITEMYTSKLKMRLKFVC